jgi:acetyl esterase/lipase
MFRFVLLAIAAAALLAQPPATPAPTATGSPAAGAQQPPIDLDRVLKQVDDLMWHVTLGDIAEVDKVEYTSLPPARVPNPRLPGATNPLIIRAYTFIPKNLDKSKPQPLIVFVHQGIHANSDTRDAHVFRELLQQGYSIISSDYRGSTGYGRGFYEQIDYGGREVDDVFQGMQWMLENYSFLDPKRVGIIGWSHGGLITLMNIFQHPQSYAVATRACRRAIWWPAWVTSPNRTGRSTPPRTTLEEPFARISRSTASARRSHTPGSFRRPC